MVDAFAFCIDQRDDFMIPEVGVTKLIRRCCQHLFFIALNLMRLSSQRFEAIKKGDPFGSPFISFAEEEGFEPPVRVNVRRFSRPVH